MQVVEKAILGAVVVLFNPTVNEINSINQYKNHVEQVIIIDNSEMDNRELLEQKVGLNTNVVYYSEKKNMGLSKALNIGMDMLMKNGCKWGMVLDADSKVDSDIVSVYMKAIADNENLSQVAIFSPVHIFDRSKKKPYHGYKTVEWAMTSGCLFNCQIFKEQAGFMEKLFVDGLDMDYCLRSNENGYKVIECGEAIVYHHPADTKNILGFKYGIASPTRYYMQARALVWCWRRYKKINMFLIYIYKWLKVIFLFPHKREYIRCMVLGTKEANKLLR